jgi:hypothetical protein
MQGSKRGGELRWFATRLGGERSEGRVSGRVEGERLKRAQSERELNTRLALLSGLECRVRLDAAR